jgi:hypothetical protein
VRITVIIIIVIVVIVTFCLFLDPSTSTSHRVNGSECEVSEKTSAGGEAREDALISVSAT